MSVDSSLNLISAEKMIPELVDVLDNLAVDPTPTVYQSIHAFEHPTYEPKNISLTKSEPTKIWGKPIKFDFKKHEKENVTLNLCQ